MKKTKLTKSQSIKKVYTNIKTEEYGNVDIVVEIRHDDRCGNGHNSFSLTGDIYEAGKEKTDRNMIVCGAIGNRIEKHIPELAHLNKWHLTSTDGPMHYVANTMYHAKDHDDMSKEVGAPTEWETRLKFENIPFTFKEEERGFFEYIKSVKNWSDVKVVAVPHVKKNGETYDFSDKYTFKGFVGDWYQAPFDTKRDAEEFLTAFNENEYSFIETPTKWNDAVKPDIDAARSCAIWGNATIEQLQDEKALLARLPKLMEAFQKDIESLGFTY